MTKPIIVAVDPRHQDVAPAAVGVMFAKVIRAPLLLAAAYTVDLSIDNVHPPHARALRRNADRAVERVAEQVAGSDVSLTTTAVPDGSSPARTLHALAEQNGAQLLVIGSSRRGPVGRVSPTAVTDRLLHGAPCTVAVAPAGFSPEPLALIGVAFVDRPDGHAALAFARTPRREPMRGYGS